MALQTLSDEDVNDLSLINADASENPRLVVFKRDDRSVRVFGQAR